MVLYFYIYFEYYLLELWMPKRFTILRNRECHFFFEIKSTFCNIFGKKNVIEACKTAIISQVLFMKRKEETLNLW